MFAVLQFFDLGVFETDDRFQVVNERLEHTNVIFMFLHQSTHQEICNIARCSQPTQVPRNRNYSPRTLVKL